MRRVSALGLLAGLLVPGCARQPRAVLPAPEEQRAPARPPEPPPDGPADAAIRKLGGLIRRDGDGRPLRVDLRRVTDPDAALRHVRRRAGVGAIALGASRAAAR